MEFTISLQNVFHYYYFRIDTHTHTLLNLYFIFSGEEYNLNYFKRLDAENGLAAAEGQQKIRKST